MPTDVALTWDSGPDLNKKPTFLQPFLLPLWMMDKDY